MLPTQPSGSHSKVIGCDIFLGHGMWCSLRLGFAANSSPGFWECVELVGPSALPASTNSLARGSFCMERGRIWDGEREKVTQGTLDQGKSRNMQAEHQGKKLSRALRELGSVWCCPRMRSWNHRMV